MSYIELSKDISPYLYPEVAEEGGLSCALRNELRRFGSHLEVTSLPDFIPNASVQLGSRSCEVFIAAQERLFTVSFWMKGVHYGDGSTQNLSELALAISCWLQEGITATAMEEKVEFFCATELGKAHESGMAVDYQWRALIDEWREHEQAGLSQPALSPLPLIEAAQHRPELRKLFPFTSMFALCFSRSTESLFARDCPSVEALGNGRYCVYSADYKKEIQDGGRKDWTPVYRIIGEGTLDEALDLLVVHLHDSGGDENEKQA